MQHGGGGHDGEGAVGFELGAVPAVGGGPEAGEHVVGACLLGAAFGGVGEGDRARDGGVGCGEERCVEFGEGAAAAVGGVEGAGGGGGCFGEGVGDAG